MTDTYKQQVFAQFINICYKKFNGLWGLRSKSIPWEGNINRPIFFFRKTNYSVEDKNKHLFQAKHQFLICSFQYLMMVLSCEFSIKKQTKQMVLEHRSPIPDLQTATILQPVGNQVTQAQVNERSSICTSDLHAYAKPSPPPLRPPLPVDGTRKFGDHWLTRVFLKVSQMVSALHILEIGSVGLELPIRMSCLKCLPNSDVNAELVHSQNMISQHRWFGVELMPFKQFRKKYLSHVKITYMLPWNIQLFFIRKSV